MVAAKPFRFGLLAAAGALLAFLGFLAVLKLGTVLGMLVAAAFFTVGLDRVVAALTRRGMRRPVAVTVVSAALLIVLCGAILLLVPGLVQQTQEFFAALPGYLDSVAADPQLQEQLTRILTADNLSRLATGLLSGVATVSGAAILALTTLGLILFMLGPFPRVIQGALRFVPATRRARARGLGEQMLEKVGGYLVGAILIAFCAATAALLWCVSTGVPYPLLLAAVVGICDMIPQVGATIGSTVAILVALTVSLPLAVLTLLFFCAYQGFENWFVYPRVMSKAVKISNLAAIVSALIGGALFGFVGVIVAVPAYASIQLLMRELVFPHQDAR